MTVAAIRWMLLEISCSCSFALLSETNGRYIFGSQLCRATFILDCLVSTPYEIRHSESVSTLLSSLALSSPTEQLVV